MTTTPAATDAFDAATAVTRVADGKYTAVLDDAYSVLGRPNGGYLLAVLGRAAVEAEAVLDANHPHCLAATASFVRPADCGEIELDVAVHRTGTSISQVRATATQGGRVVVDALLSCGRLDAGDVLRLPGPPPPAMPPPEACRHLDGVVPDGPGIAIMERVELRLDPATTGYLQGEVVDDAEVRGWIRLGDGRAADPLGLLFLVDALPPATFAIGSSGWVPTIQLTAYVRALPADGWLAARQVARTVAGSVVDEVCELWDADGRVVAQATQLAMVRFA